jgi:hypothetical protein
MQDMLAQIWAYIQQYVPNLLAAIAILVLGWFAAIVLSYLVRIAVNKIARGKQLQEAVGTDIATTQKVGVWTGRVVFWVLMGFVVAAALQSLQLTSLSEPLDRVLQELTLYLPQLLGAVILVVIAWVLGLVLRFVVVRALDKTSLDKRVSESAGLGAERQLSKTM